jgi:hypothetical protein
MLRSLLLSSWIIVAVTSFTPPLQQQSAQSRTTSPVARFASTTSSDDEDTAAVSSRRTFFLSVTAAAVAAATPRRANALQQNAPVGVDPDAEDPLDAFAQQLQQQSEMAATAMRSDWPGTAAQDLPPSPLIPLPAEETPPASDLETAMKSAQKKKQVDPRTHG